MIDNDAQHDDTPANADSRMSPRRVIVLAVGFALAAIIWVTLETKEPAGDSPGLTPQARNLAVVFVITITLWATEAIPIAISSLAVVALLPLFGVADIHAAIQSFVSPVFIFVLAMFILAGVIHRTGLDKRLALLLLSKAGSSPGRVLLAFMIGTALLSTIISDVPACGVFMALGIGVLQRMKATPGESRFGRALMMGIPIAALIGGVATPAGSSINVLGLEAKLRVVFAA